MEVIPFFFCVRIQEMFPEANKQTNKKPAKQIHHQTTTTKINKWKKENANHKKTNAKKHE